MLCNLQYTHIDTHSPAAQVGRSVGLLLCWALISKKVRLHSSRQLGSLPPVSSPTAVTWPFSACAALRPLYLNPAQHVSSRRYHSLISQHLRDDTAAHHCTHTAYTQVVFFSLYLSCCNREVGIIKVAALFKNNNSPYCCSAISRLYGTITVVMDLTVDINSSPQTDSEWLHWPFEPLANTTTKLKLDWNVPVENK